MNDKKIPNFDDLVFSCEELGFSVKLSSGHLHEKKYYFAFFLCADEANGDWRTKKLILKSEKRGLLCITMVEYFKQYIAGRYQRVVAIKKDYENLTISGSLDIETHEVKLDIDS